jgi:hypothetical protein
LNWKKARRIVSWTVATICLGYIVLIFWKQRKELDIALSLNPLVIGILVALFVSLFFLHCYRYLVVLEKNSGENIPYWPWFKIYTLGRFLNTFFPQTGNLYRGVLLKRDHGVTYTRYISSYAAYAWMDSFMTTCVTIVIVAIFDPGLYFGEVRAIGALVGLALIIAAGPPVALGIFRIVEARLNRQLWLYAKISEVIKVMVQSIADPMFVFKVFYTGLVLFAGLVAIFFLFLHSLQAYISFSGLALFCALNLLSTYIHITPANLGVQELSYGILSEVLGIGMETGILFSAIFRVFGSAVVLSLALPLGGVSLLRNRKEYEEEKEIREVGPASPAQPSIKF